MQTEILTEALTSTSSNSLRQKKQKSRNRQNDSICRDKHKTEKYEIQPENQKAGSMWQLLMALRDCELKNDALMDTLYDIIMENIRITTPYAIYVFHDNYDIPAKATDKERLGESEEMFPYLICAICPLVGEYEPGSPTSGFLFPAFTDRSGDLNHINIYGITEKKREELGRLISL